MRRLLLLSIACAATFAAGQKVVGGPVVVNVTSGTATVVWVVESDQATLRAPAAQAARVSPSCGWRRRRSQGCSRTPRSTIVFTRRTGMFQHTCKQSRVLTMDCQEDTLALPSEFG